MLRKFMFATVGLGALGLAAASSGSAQAAGAHLSPTLRNLPIESNLIEVQSKPKAKVAPRRAAPRHVAPPRAAPRHVAPRHVAPRYRWARDRRHRYYGAFFAVPFGFGLYATHYCYDWRFGPGGWGYYWNYFRCPL
jgi:hypothetical protein